jgi:hypothetical protein
MEVPLGVVTGDSEHMYGSGMEVQLGVVTGDSEHYVWLRNRGAVGCHYR